MSIKRQRGKIV